MDDPRKIELPVRVYGPIPPETRRKISNLEAETVCGGRDGFVWNRGPQKNLAVTGYCAEPRCMTEGACPAPRFVPHQPQYTELDDASPTARRREISIREAVAAVKEFHRRAVKRGARPDTRTDREIAKHILTTWTKMAVALAGKGDWTPG